MHLRPDGRGGFYTSGSISSDDGYWPDDDRKIRERIADTVMDDGNKGLFIVILIGSILVSIVVIVALFDRATNPEPYNTLDTLQANPATTVDWLEVGAKCRQSWVDLPQDQKNFHTYIYVQENNYKYDASVLTGLKYVDDCIERHNGQPG